MLYFLPPSSHSLWNFLWAVSFDLHLVSSSTRSLPLYPLTQSKRRKIMVDCLPVSPWHYIRLMHNPNMWIPLSIQIPVPTLSMAIRMRKRLKVLEALPV